MSKKKSAFWSSKASDAIDFEYDSCGLPGNSSDSLQPEDDFVWVEQKDLFISNNVILSDEHRNSKGAFSNKCIEGSPIKPNQGASIEDTLMSDLIEDDSYDYHGEQYDSTVEKVSHYKKKITNKKIKIPSMCTVTNRSQAEQVFNIDMFDKTTAEMLKSIVSSSNYYSGNFGFIISKKPNSVVVHAYISKKEHRTWEPGAKPFFMYAFINNGYKKRYRRWRTEDNAVKVYKLCDDEVKNKRIFQQVQKEKEHLCLLNRAKCKVPVMRRCSRNILVMSLVGTDGVTAPSIDTLATDPLKRSEEMYQTIVKDVQMWYKTLHLVHGKLSTENVLFWNKEVYYIEWSHSVKTEHPLALKKLMKDCCFITKFFEERDVPVRSTEKLFKDITGLNDIDESVLSVINTKGSKDLWKSQHLTNPNGRTCSHTLGPSRSCWFK